MTRLIEWGVRRVGPPTLLTGAMLGTALLCVALVLSRLVRGLDFDLLATMALVGAAVGWLLGRSRFAAQIALPAGLFAGLTALAVRVGQLGDEILALILAVGHWTRDAQAGRFTISEIGIALSVLLRGLGILGDRLELWLRSVAVGQPIYDPVAAAMIWGLLTWLLAAWAGWMLRRAAKPFWACAPFLALFALVLAYTGTNILAMALVILALLGLMIVVPYAARLRRWQSHNLPYADDLGFDLTLIAVPTVLFIAVVAALIPAFSPREIARWVQLMSPPATSPSNTLTNSLGLVPAPRATSVFDEAVAPGMPRSHLLGASPELLHKLAFTVELDAPAPPQTILYYWLSSTYDVYTGGGWLTSSLRSNTYDANELAQAENVPSYLPVHQTIRTQRAAGLVYAAGSVISVDHNFQVAWRGNEDMFAAQVQANLYRVESRVPIYDEAALRAAGQGYPDWVVTRYLALPDEVPQRVLALARDLTATAPTPYDRARAIESYLRTLPYTLNLPEPPGSRDVVDYFLFDLKRGYCDYYSSAMTVLARAAGLPARVAVGYATGTFDPTARRYVVTEAEAHSWTQVYFPNYGWVDFEPTSARSPRDLQEPRGYWEVGRPPQISGKIEGEGVGGLALPDWKWLVPAIGLGLMLLIGLASLIDLFRLRRSAPSVAMAALYRRLYQIAGQLGLPVTASHTPHQVGEMLEAYFDCLAHGGQLLMRQPSLGETVSEVVTGYVQTTYGARPPSRSQSALMIAKWEQVRPQLWMARMLHLVHRLSYLRSHRNGSQNSRNGSKQ